MATHLGHGVLGFSRERIGYRSPAGDMSPMGRIKGASIHHGGPVGGPRMTFKSARATCLGWQAFHIDERGWSDIGYTFLVDGLGRVYQGRSIRYAPAAVGGHNTGIPGINFMQDGRYFALNPLQRYTLRVMFKYGIPKWGLPPLKDLGFVKGHQEFDGHEGNECPGGHIMRHLRWARGHF